MPIPCPLCGSCRRIVFDHRRWVSVNLKYRFFLPKKVLQKVFRAKLREALNDAFAAGQIEFHGRSSTFPTRRRSVALSADYSVTNGLFTANDLRRSGICTPISRRYTIALRFPITGWFPLPTLRSLFSGEIAPMATGNNQ